MEKKMKIWNLNKLLEISVCLTKELYSKYINNSYNSIIKKTTWLKMEQNTGMDTSHRRIGKWLGTICSTLVLIRNCQLKLPWNITAVTLMVKLWKTDKIKILVKRWSNQVFEHCWWENKVLQSFCKISLF